MLYTLESNSLLNVHASYQAIRERYYCTMYVIGNMYNLLPACQKHLLFTCARTATFFSCLASSNLHRQCSLADEILDAVPTCTASKQMPVSKTRNCSHQCLYDKSGKHSAHDRIAPPRAKQKWNMHNGRT